jgi:hypothetical protein
MVLSKLDKLHLHILFCRSFLHNLGRISWSVTLHGGGKDCQSKHSSLLGSFESYGVNDSRSLYQKTFYGYNKFHTIMSQCLPQ